MCRTFQNIRLFGSMTALENVLVGLHCRTRGGLLAPLLEIPLRRSPGEAAARSRAAEVLELVGLAARAGQAAVELPYGEPRRLEIARARARDPRPLRRAEPPAGMPPRAAREPQAFRGAAAQRAGTDSLL